MTNKEIQVEPKEQRELVKINDNTFALRTNNVKAKLTSEKIYDKAELKNIYSELKKELHGRNDMIKNLNKKVKEADMEAECQVDVLAKKDPKQQEYLEKYPEVAQFMRNSELSGRIKTQLDSMGKVEELQASTIELREQMVQISTTMPELLRNK